MLCVNESLTGRCQNFNSGIVKDIGNYAGDSKVNSVMQEVLYLYAVPVFICMGIIGNAIVLYGVRTSALAGHSVAVYVTAYTIANILSMVFNSSMDWAYLMLGVRHFKNDSDTLCRVWQFFIRLVTYSGIWFAVAMATDRYIIVWHGHRKKQLCTTFNAKVTVCIILVAMVTLSIHAMWTYDLSYHGWCIIPTQTSSSTSGSGGGTRYDVHRLVWPWVSGLLYSLVPILCIFVLGNAIVIKQCHDREAAAREEWVSAQLTRTVTFICFSNFVLNTPATAMNILDNTLPAAWKENPSNGEIMEIVRDSTILLLCLNYVEILPAFVICSKVFRDALCRTMRFPRKPETREMECTAV